MWPIGQASDESYRAVNKSFRYQKMELEAETVHLIGKSNGNRTVLVLHNVNSASPNDSVLFVE